MTGELPTDEEPALCGGPDDVPNNGGRIASSMYASRPVGESQSAYAKVCGRSDGCEVSLDVDDREPGDCADRPVWNISSSV